METWAPQTSAQCVAICRVVSKRALLAWGRKNWSAQGHFGIYA